MQLKHYQEQALRVPREYLDAVPPAPIFRHTITIRVSFSDSATWKCCAVSTRAR